MEMGPHDRGCLDHQGSGSREWGKEEQGITFSGSYPADVPSYQSFQNLHKQNDHLAIKIHIQNMNL